MGPKDGFLHRYFCTLFLPQKPMLQEATSSRAVSESSYPQSSKYHSIIPQNLTRLCKRREECLLPAAHLADLKGKKKLQASPPRRKCTMTRLQIPQKSGRIRYETRCKTENESMFMRFEDESCSATSHSHPIPCQTSP